MFGTQDRHVDAAVIHLVVPLRVSDLIAWVCGRVCARTCVCVMDLDISLWGIIWTASTAIFLYEYFTII